MKDTENRPPSRKRRKWGSVIVRRDADGNPASFQARYVNPLDPPKKVGRNFGLEYETEAYKWLDVEHYLVALHNKGIRQWVHPSQRGADTMPIFREYSEGDMRMMFLLWDATPGNRSLKIVEIPIKTTLNNPDFPEK